MGGKDIKTKILFRGLALVQLFSILGCSSVHMSPKKPLLYDVNISVDLKSPPVQQPYYYSYGSIQERRRMRMGQIQSLKNSRMIGEGKDGYLHVLKNPEEEEYKDYIHKVVDEENRDRLLLYAMEAKKSGKEISQVEKEYGQKWQSRAFKGELIEGEEGWQAKNEDLF